MTANKAFYFAYPNGFGGARSNNEMIGVNFLRYEGHGICFRAGVDFNLEKRPTCLHNKIRTTRNIKLRVEFKTEASGGCADTSSTLDITTRCDEWYLDVPKMCSPLKEICIAALKCDNENVTECRYSVPLFDLL